MTQTLFDILNIAPTTDKMAIKRAYVRETKKHHPDQGGDPQHFCQLREAYEELVNQKHVPTVLTTEVRIPLRDFLYGCVATVSFAQGPLKESCIEFTIPAHSYPGSFVEFYDNSLTPRKIRVKLLETSDEDYIRLDSSIIIRRQINNIEAKIGKTFNIKNFDGLSHIINISPKTTADRLIFNFPGAGFYERETHVRGNLTIIVEVQKEGN